CRYRRDRFDRSITGRYAGERMVVDPSGRPLAGIAVSGDELFVVQAVGDYEGEDRRTIRGATIAVYDRRAFDGRVTRSWPAPRARTIIPDGHGGLWVLQQRGDGAGPRIARYSAGGRRLAQRIDTVAEPTAM